MTWIVLWRFRGDVDDEGDDDADDGGDGDGVDQLEEVSLHTLPLRDDDGDNNVDDNLKERLQQSQPARESCNKRQKSYLSLNR